MDITKINRIRDRLERLWNRLGNIHPSEFTSLLEAVGRKRIKKSTKHIMYESPFPDRPSISVSGHPGPMSKGWAWDIITELYNDLDKLEELELERLNRITKGNGHVKDSG